MILAAAIALAPAGASASSGYVSTHGELSVVRGTNTGEITLATTEYVPSVNVAGAPNPKVYWGDGSEQEAQVSLAGFNCTQCELRGAHTYAAPGTYNVEVVYNTGAAVWYTTTFQIVVTPSAYTFASIGDSVASGEGNPDGLTEGGLPQAIWDDGLGPTIAQTYPAGSSASPCHQSQYAPPTQAEKLFAHDTNLAVSYTQLACAGANIPQVIEKQVSRLPAGIDALMMTLGANDIDGGFANLIETCLKEQGYCQNNEAFTKRVAQDVKELPGWFARLNEALLQHDVRAVFISEYYDPTRNAAGNFGNVGSNYLCTLDLLNAATWEWAYENVLKPLNEAIANAAKAYGWHLVGGIASAFRNHGFCAWTQGQSWVRAFEPGEQLSVFSIVPQLESLKVELQISGTAHPNHEGESQITNRIAETIRAQLPVPETQIHGGAPPAGTGYSFNSETDEQVLVGFSAQTTLPSLMGVKATYYSIDNESCSPAELSACVEYSQGSGGVLLRKPGTYHIKYFSETEAGVFEIPQITTVRIVPAPLEGATLSAEQYSPSTGADEGPYTPGSWTQNNVTLTIHGSGEVHYAVDDHEACTTNDYLMCKVAKLPLTLKLRGEGAHTVDLPGFGAAYRVLEVYIDRAGPKITFDGYSPARNGAGWNNGTVILTWSCAAGAAPVLKSKVSWVTDTEGTARPVTGICDDQAGLSKRETRTVNIDMEPPSEVKLSTSRAPKETGTNGVPVFTGPFTVTATAVDVLSGLKGCTSASYSGPAVTGGSVSGTCSDRAGNKVSWSYSFDYNPPRLLTLSSGNTPLAAGSAVLQSAFVETCALNADGKLISNGGTTDRIAVKAPGTSTCFGGPSSISGAITEDRLSGSGNVEMLAGVPVRLSLPAGLVPGSCTYEFTKFEGSFGSGETSNIRGSGTGTLVEQPFGAMCPPTRAASVSLTIGDLNAGTPLTAAMST